MFSRLMIATTIMLIAIGVMALMLIVPAQASENGSPFVEDNVDILYAYDGEAIADGYGWISRRLDDFNADGVDDFLVTSPFYLASQTYQGRAYVYSGIDGSLVITHTGVGVELLGWDAAIAGDVDQDGTSDYIIGAPWPSRAYVYSGADHSTILTLSGTPGAWFGAGVAGPGDVNGDTIPDLLVGSTNFSPSAVVTNTGKVTMLSGADGSELWSVEGENGQDNMGNGLTPVTDIDNDGVDDVMVGAPGFNEGNGKVYVFSGVDGTELESFEPNAPLLGGTFGRFFISGQHDVNADGVDDLYIGDFGAITATGRAYVYSGADLDPNADQDPLYQLEGSGEGEGFGIGRFIPDANNDGHDDMIIASWRSSDHITQSGKVEIYSGADGSVLHTATGAIEQDGLGVDALYLGDLNSDGRPEYMVTAVGLDFAGLDVGHAYVISFNEDPSRIALSQHTANTNQPVLSYLVLFLLLLTAGIALPKFR